MKILPILLVVIATNPQNTQIYKQLKQSMAVFHQEEQHAKELLELWDNKLTDHRKIYVLPTNKQKSVKLVHNKGKY